METNQTTIADFLDRGVQSARAVNPIHLELAWIAFVFIYWASHIARATSKTSYSKIFNIPQPVFLLHVFSSLAEVVRYHVHLGLTGQRPEATNVDLVICVLQSFSSFWLTSNIHRAPRGELELTRATFQAMAIQRLIATGLALQGGGFGIDGPTWHRASVKLVQNFIWARFILLTISDLVAGLGTYGSKYTTAILGCHLMGMWEGGYPNGMGIYFGLLLVLLGFDKWAQRFKR